jgi:uncharacterized SAM-binding protein YcdF (DUF218 family)
MKYLLIFLLTPYIAGFIAFKGYTDSLTTENYPKDIDAAVLFTGGNGRLEMGANYLKTFPSKALLITGVHPEINMDILLKEGILPEQSRGHVQLDYEARDTIDNVRMVKRWANSKQFHSVALITSAYHIPRSLLLFDRITPNLKIVSLPVKNTKTSWFYLLKEYNKYLYTYMSVFA